jgi:hypothetical protein
VRQPATIEGLEMYWMLMTLTAFVGLVALMVVILARRVPSVKELGSMSSRWMTEHFAD